MTEPPGWLAHGAVPRLREDLLTARDRLAPYDPGTDARQAAVLLLFGPGTATTTSATTSASTATTTSGPDPRTPGHDADPRSAHLLLTRRSAHLRSHAGQVAFPGGRVEPGDTGPAATALREAAEEVALDPSSVTVVAELPVLHVVPSNNDVTPVVGWWHAPGPLRPDLHEVDAVTTVPLADLADPAVRIGVRHPSGGVWPGFDVPGGFLVWGFTAWVVDRVLASCGLDGAWDASPVLEMPPRVPASGPVPGGADVP